MQALAFTGDTSVNALPMGCAAQRFIEPTLPCKPRRALERSAPPQPLLLDTEPGGAMPHTPLAVAHSVDITE
jgi:hypothetical protein